MEKYKGYIITEGCLKGDIVVISEDYCNGTWVVKSFVRNWGTESNWYSRVPKDNKPRVLKISYILDAYSDCLEFLPSLLEFCKKYKLLSDKNMNKLENTVKNLELVEKLKK